MKREQNAGRTQQIAWDFVNIRPSERTYSAFMFAAPITLPHFSVSSARCLPNSAGENSKAVEPRLARRALNFGSARPALISLLSALTISADVFRGAPIPNQPLAS